MGHGAPDRMALRGRTVLAQHGQQVLVGPDEKGLVAGAEPGAAAGRVLEQLLVVGTPQGQHPGPRADRSLMASPLSPPPGLIVSRATSSGLSSA